MLENFQTVRENAEIFIKSSKDIGLVVNFEKTKYMITSRHSNVIQNKNIVITDLSFEKCGKVQISRSNSNRYKYMREEIKLRINMGNACYYSLEKILSPRLLSKKLKVKTFKTIILPVVLYICETWSLSLREEHRLRVFENKVLRKIFGAKKHETTREWRKLDKAELHALYSSRNIIRSLKSRRLRWAGYVASMEQSGNAYRV